MEATNSSCGRFQAESDLTWYCCCSREVTIMPSPTNLACSFESLLSERGTLAVPQAVELVRQLTEQVAALHGEGRIHGAIAPHSITVDDNLHPALVTPAAGSAVQLDDNEWVELLPELERLAPRKLPSEIDAARQRLEAAGIALDPRQIDLCQLGSLLCRVLTGESTSAYLRSARVKGKVPTELRGVLERAAGLRPTIFLQRSR